MRLGGGVQERDMEVRSVLATHDGGRPDTFPVGILGRAELRLPNKRLRKQDA